MAKQPPRTGMTDLAALVRASAGLPAAPTVDALRKRSDELAAAEREAAARLSAVRRELDATTTELERVQATADQMTRAYLVARGELPDAAVRGPTPFPVRPVATTDEQRAELARQMVAAAEKSRNPAGVDPPAPTDAAKAFLDAADKARTGAQPGGRRR